MKTVLIVCLACIAVTAAATANVPDDDPILTQESNVDYTGKFHYHFETGKGAAATQDGYLKTIDPEHEGEAIEGQFSYAGDDGQQYAISYTADENGYQPHGPHIPTPPPVPEAIQRALKYIEEHPYVEPSKKPKH